jgi:hypothetical protein
MIFKGEPGSRYIVSEYGDVFNLVTGTYMKTHLHKGYKCIMMSMGVHKRKRLKVHQLVCIAFHGPRPPGLVVNHKDANKLNNHYTNLEWITHGENMRHARRMVVFKQREKKLHTACISAIPVLHPSA